MTIRSLVAAAAGAAALMVPAVPSHAVSAELCQEPGYVGVVVYDDDGELVHACVRITD